MNPTSGTWARRATFAVLAATALLALPRPAAAMGPGKMTDDEWFATTRNKVVVLEYDTPASAGPSGRQLAELIAQMMLATVSDVDSFAVLALRQDQRADARIELTPANVEALARKQRAPVIIWGEFYEVGDRLFVTSHLRLVEGASPATRPATIFWDTTSGGGGGGGRMQASLPTSQVNFAPIEVPAKRLQTITQLWTQTRDLRKDPQETAPVVAQLPPDQEFYLSGKSGAWSQVTLRDGPTGWVRFGDIAEQPEFREVGGLVDYAIGLAQYLAGKPAAAAATFEKYLAGPGAAVSRHDAMNRATARTLLGYAYLTDPARPPADQIKLATEQFEQAERLVPQSPAPTNALAVALCRKAAQARVDAAEVRQLERQLVDAIRNRNDLASVRNLATLYQQPYAATYLDTGGGDFSAARAARLEVLGQLEQEFYRPAPAATSQPVQTKSDAPATQPSLPRAS